MIIFFIYNFIFLSRLQKHLWNQNQVILLNLQLHGLMIFLYGCHQKHLAVVVNLSMGVIAPLMIRLLSFNVAYSNNHVYKFLVENDFFSISKWWFGIQNFNELDCVVTSSTRLTKKKEKTLWLKPVWSVVSLLLVVWHAKNFGSWQIYLV